MKTQKNKFGKTLSLMLSIFMAGIFALSSCSSDDGDGGSSGGNSYVILDGKKYGMNGGYPVPPAYYFGNNVSGNKSLTLTLFNGYPDTRHFNITFHEKEKYEELNSGTYTYFGEEYPYPNSAGVFKPEEHFTAGVVFEYDCGGFPVQCSEATLISGTVTIVKSETSNITIDFEGMTDKGAIKAYYKGEIKSEGNISI